MLENKIRYLITIIIFVYCTSTSLSFEYEDFYSSFSDIKQLFINEKHILYVVEEYIQKEEQRLQKMKEDIAELVEEHNVAIENPTVFLESAINAYILIKRLTTDWTSFENEMDKDIIGQRLLTNLTDQTGILHFPGLEDLTGAAKAIVRIQKTYNIDAKDMALGVIDGKRASYRELSVEDCYVLGRQFYFDKDCYNAMKWMNEALSRFYAKKNPTMKRHEILGYIAYCNYLQNNISTAIEQTKIMLEEVPDHARYLKNLRGFEKILVKGEQNNVEGQLESLEGNPENKTSNFTLNFNRLCRGEGSIPENISKNFYCFYQNGPSNFLRIAPVKTEIVHINPTVFVYYEVISDDEIKHTQNLAIPRFQRALVQGYSDSKHVKVDYRISKNAWLYDYEHMSVNKRIEIITGMPLKSGEQLQVGNYGIGGHYTPHHDYARENQLPKTANYENGNRIATWMYYLSDVSIGGATVFPKLDLAIWPKKGAAAFWFNMLPNGRVDPLTLHGGCPIVLGQKWVANKWIHERHQEDKYACRLNYEDKWDLSFL